MANRQKNIKRKNKKSEDSFIYIVVLLMFTILLVAINKIYDIGFGVIILPIILFINNYIFKEFSSRDEKVGLIVSGLSIIMYLFLLYNLMNRVISVLDVFKEVSIFIISLVINNMIYKRVIKNKEKKYIVFNYILVMISYLILYIIF